MKITWFGTACIKMESEGKTILFDPYIRRYGGAEEKLKKVFQQEKTILITHGHFDHIADMKEIFCGKGDVVIYGSRTPLDSLKRDGLKAECLKDIRPGSKLKIGGFAISILQGKHIQYDARLVRRVLLNVRIFKYLKELWGMLQSWNKYLENGEILFYDMQVEGKHIQLMGSSGLQMNVQYPQGADLLVLPYQGRSDLAQYSLPIVEKLKPKKIMLSHFDDAFPPITSKVDTQEFYDVMKHQFPDIEVMIPQLDVSYTI